MTRTETMEPLPDQKLFEALLGKQEDPRLPTVPTRAVIWFTATWCGPCKRVDSAALLAQFPQIVFYKCDVDENDYTGGYCGVRSIPTFLAIEKGKVLGTFQSSETEKIAAWFKSTFAGL